MPHVTVHISETALDGKAHSSAPARHRRGADPSFTVRYGKAAGLPATGTKYTQDSAGVPGADEDYDSFGAAVAVGDATGDGYADIAVGARTRAWTATEASATSCSSGAVRPD
ncbi:FG-GAP repeat protein [Streptomyces sp. NPDC085866]|uniref:FG-GAP repeat protein n=1 Tax=Streptomyces sp. NPDC085866 TaxID=3365736 RepID=UPI0037D150BE